MNWTLDDCTSKVPLRLKFHKVHNVLDIDDDQWDEQKNLVYG